MPHAEARTAGRAGRPGFFRRDRLPILILAWVLALSGIADCRADTPASGQAQDDRDPPYGFTDLGNPMDAIAFASDGRQGLAVGSAGTILRSGDGGKSWERVEGVPVKSELHSVCLSSDGSRGCAVGDFGVALRTVDSGRTWQRTYPLSIRSLRSVALSPDGQHAWIAGELGALFYSVDGGVTWKAADGVAMDDSLESVTFSSDGLRGWAAGQDGLMLLSVDGGLTWRHATGISKSEYLQAVVFSPDGRRGWTVGDYGAIYRSADGGRSWAKTDDVPTDVFLNTVAFAADGQHGWAAGDSSTVLLTGDGGATWRKLARVPTRQEILSMGFAADGQHGWATGDFGTLLSSDDAGQTWQRSGGPPTEQALHSVVFADDARRGWAVGGASTILRTGDGGMTWQRAAVAPPRAELESVAFAKDGERGWAVGVNGTILRTTDGGQNWRKVAGAPDAHILYSVAFAADGRRGWAVGANGTLLNSTDGGLSWQSHAGVPTSRDLNAVAVTPDGTRGWAVGADGTLLRTTNGGQTWKQAAGIVTQRTLRCVFAAADGLRLWATGDYQTFVRSTDGGETWRTVNEGSGVRTGSVAFAADGRRGWSVGGDGYVMRTADGGDFWWYVGHQPGEGELLSVAVSPDGRHVWAVGDHGTILRSSSTPSDARPFEGRISAHLETRDGVILPIVTLDGHGPSAPLVSWHLSLSGPRATGDLAAAFNRTFTNGQPVPGWKRDELGPGVYTCHVEATDGWNIVTAELPFGNGPWERFVGFMGWDIVFSETLRFAKEHGTQNLGLLLALYVLAIAGLFAFKPSLFVLWHEKAAPLIAALPIPGKATDKVTQLAGLFLITRARALDAVVAEFAPIALAELEKLPEAAARLQWVAAPLQVEDELFGRTDSPFASSASVPTGELYIRGLTELKRHLVNRRWWLSIEGPGGVGKSALAFQMARWFAAHEPESRLHMAQAIPIYIRSLKEGLDVEVLAELKRILGLPRLSTQLAEALLSRRRVLVLVDGISEKAADVDELALGPLNPAKCAGLVHLAVMTSRRRIQLPEVVKVLPQPVDLGSIDEVLSRYLDDVVGAGRFSPSQREAIREALKGIMKEMSRDNGHPPQIPMVFVKLIIQRADEILAKDDSSGTPDPAESALPKDLAGLVDAYLSSLLEALPNGMEEASLARRAALACVGGDGIPKWRPLAAYEQRSLKHGELEGLVTIGLMVRDGADVGDPLYKFALDPIAEYLAAKEMVLAVRDARMTLEQLTGDRSHFAPGSDVPAKIAQIARALGVRVA
jgi:photosystem II stability/assembly factor-like uncharacterized protein